MIFVNRKRICRDDFPDGTPLFKNLPSFHNEKELTFRWAYDNDAELINLIMIVGHYRDVLPKSTKFTLELSYLPNARFDRKKQENEVFTLKYFCNIINSLNFDEIEVYDIHSNVGAALLNNFRHSYKLKYTIGNLIITKKPDVLFFPDEGSFKRYYDLIKDHLKENYGLHVPDVAFANKDRDWDTGTIKGLTIQNGDIIKDKNVLIIDDICSKGTTFVYSAKALKELGAKNIELYVSHCEHTIFDGELIKSGLLNRIYTTDSIFTKEHELINVKPMFRINNDD